MLLTSLHLSWGQTTLALRRVRLFSGASDPAEFFILLVKKIKSRDFPPYMKRKHMPKKNVDNARKDTFVKGIKKQVRFHQIQEESQIVLSTWHYEVIFQQWQSWNTWCVHFQSCLSSASSGKELPVILSVLRVDCFVCSTFSSKRASFDITRSYFSWKKRGFDDL